MSTAPRWAGTTYGNGWMHRTLTFLLRYVDVRVVYLFTYVFVVPPCLVLRHSYLCTYRYFRRHHGCSPVVSFFKTYANHCRFSQMVIDKFAMYAGRHFSFTVDGEELFARYATGASGFVLLSAHVGNYELAGYSLVSHGKSIHALVFGDEKTTVMAQRSRLFAHTNIRMIPIGGGDMQHLFALTAALEQHDIVSMPGDRTFGSEKTLSVPFLGAAAPFPVGPYAFAAMHAVPVLTVHVMKTGTYHYTVFVRPVPYDCAAPRREQVQQIATGYVSQLETTLRAFSTQWFNYYDFWA